MNESKFSVANGARLAMVVLAFVTALVAVQAFGAKPAEALCAYPGPPPGKDPFAEAQQLRVGTGSTVYCMEHEGTTAGATMEAGEPRPYASYKDCGIYGISNSVWWKVTVPSNLPSYLYGTTGGAYLKLSTGGSSFDTVLAVYKGSSLTSLQQAACSNENKLPNWNDLLYAPSLAKGQTYYVQLSGTGGARSGSYKLISTWVTQTEYVRATRL
jgi:hypothetical protein